MQLTAPAGTVRAPTWNPAGTAIALAVAGGGRSVIWRVSPVTGRSVRLSRTDGVASAPEWSPNGRAVVFAFTKGLDRSLRIVPAGGGTERLLPGTVGYADPDWSTAGGLLTPSPELLPDLDQRAPADVAVTMVDGAWRLGFASATENIGDGPLWLRGTRERPGQLRADQVITLRDGGTRVVRRVGRMRYEYHSPHFHWHFQPFVRYELRTAADHRLLVRDRKSGFCLIDRWSRGAHQGPGGAAPRFTSNCGERNRNVRRVDQGTSRGYSDIYPAFYHGQDINLTGVPDGRYVLVHRVNPERQIREIRYGNDAASVLLWLRRPGGPGDAARGAGAAGVRAHRVLRGGHALLLTRPRRRRSARSIRTPISTATASEITRAVPVPSKARPPNHPRAHWKVAPQHGAQQLRRQEAPPRQAQRARGDHHHVPPAGHELRRRDEHRPARADAPLGGVDPLRPAPARPQPVQQPPAEPAPGEEHRRVADQRPRGRRGPHQRQGQSPSAASTDAATTADSPGNRGRTASPATSPSTTR